MKRGQFTNVARASVDLITNAPSDVVAVWHGQACFPNMEANTVLFIRQHPECVVFSEDGNAITEIKEVA